MNGRVDHTITQQSIEFAMEVILNTYWNKSGKSAFHIIAGILPTVDYSINRESIIAATQLKTEYEFDDNTWQIGFTAGFGYKFQLKNKTTLNIEPHYRGFLPVVKPITVEESNYGIRAQLLFNLTKKEG